MNQVASFGLLALVASMILGGIPPSAEAASDSNVLLRLVERAQTQIEQQMENNDDPKVEELYAEGLAQVKLLREAIDKPDVDSARDHFLSAMRIFKQITQMISDRPTVDAGDKTEAKLEAVQAAPQRDYESDLKRLAKYVTSLKSVAKTHGADIDFSKLDGLFESARKQMKDPNSGDVEESIDKIKRIVLDVNRTIREYSNQKAEDRAQNYANQYLEKVDRLIGLAEKANLTDAVTALKEAQRKLEAASSTAEVIKEIRKIISIEQEFDLTKANKLESRMMQLDKKLASLSQAEIDKSEISDLRKILREIKQLISKGELDDANSKLQELNEKIKELNSNS